LKKDMTVGREWKQILLFTLPIMAGNLLQQLYNTVDGMVVGNYIGDEAFAGVGICSALGFIFLAVAMGLGTGISIVISQYFGAHRYGDLRAAIDTSIIIMGGVGLVFSVAGYLLTPFLLTTVLNTPPELMPYASLFFRIYAIGFVFQFLYNGIASVLRGMGDSKASLYFLIITSVLNAGLAVLFVIAFKWGVAGTGIATVIAQAVCAALSYVYLKKRFTFESDGRHFDKTACRHILRFGIPSSIQALIVSFGNTAMQRLINGFDNNNLIAAVSAGNRVTMLLFVPVFGFQAGLATFTGQNIGAGRLDRVKRGFRSTISIAIGLSLVMSVLLYVFAPFFVRLFGVNGAALTLGVEMLRFYAFTFCIFGFQMTLNGVLQGAGDIFIQSFATLLALGLRVSLGYLAVHFGILGYQAAWVTDPVGMVLATIIVVVRYASGKWKTKAVVHLEQPAEIQQVCAEIEE
jgi:putative MATE family efflux protein